MTKAEAWEILNKFDVFCRIITTLDVEVAAKNISQISMSHCVGTKFKTVAEYIIENSSEELACHIYAVVYLTFSRVRSVCNARKILDKAVSIGLINANYSRKDWKQVSKSELHLFVLYAKTELKLGKRGWKPFEILWGTTYLQSGYSKISMDKEERIRRLFSDDVIRQAEKSI